MRRWRLWLVIALAAVPLLALGALHGLTHLFTPPPLEEAFAGRPLPATQFASMEGGRRVFFAETGNLAGPLVLMVHGTPGSWMDSVDVLRQPELAARARLVSLDRPGWGGSAEGGLAPALQVQAAAIAAVLRARPANRPAIVVGHSLGGAVIARAAMDYPELIDALVIVAGSIDPALERTMWYQRLALSPLLRWAVPEPLVRSARELASLRAELEDMLPRWGSLEQDVVVIQGDDDRLVPRAHADFAERVLPKGRVVIERVPRQGHLIPWQRPELIAEAVLELLDRGLSEER